VKSLASSGEPDVRSALAEGADIVCFSGDKLLGGPQAGILVGKKEIIDQLGRAPLMRALRVGKLTIAALSSVVRSYLDEKSAARDIPVQRLLHRPKGDIKVCGEQLLKQLSDAEIQAKLVKSTGRCGGGAMPDFDIDSYAITLVVDRESQKRRSAIAEKVYRRLLDLEVPVVGVLRQGEFMLDLLAVFETDLAYIGSELAKAAAAELSR
jgi:L-seryl-tRNA(Ser) seleniumtransferase